MEDDGGHVVDVEDVNVTPRIMVAEQVVHFLEGVAARPAAEDDLAAVSVDDLSGKLAELAKSGIEPIWYDPGGMMAYLNSDKVGGVMFELVLQQSSPVT